MRYNLVIFQRISSRVMFMHGGLNIPEVGYNKNDGILIQIKDEKFKINPRKLRLECEVH